MPAQSCPECHTELPNNAPNGLCPKCLLRAGFQSANEPEPNAQPLAATLQASEHLGLPEVSHLASQFPDLEIDALLGHGGMGAVYRARQVRLDRIVALKIIRPDSAKDPMFAERFNREARTLARLNHPNIVAVHDFGEVTVSGANDDAQTLYYFIMEYVDGANLRQLLAAGELTSQRALKIVPQICDALQFAHDEGIVHRDIKPENILVDQRGRVRIADFGLAKILSDDIVDDQLTGTHQVMGTPRYMAPEQMKATHDVDHRADIYSLGVVFYEMLTGDTPFGRFDPPSQMAAVDEQWDQVVMRTLEKEPQRRYQNASEVKSDVEKMSVVNPAPATSEPATSAGTSPSPRPAGKPNVGAFILGGTLMAVGIPLLIYSLLTSNVGAFLWVGLGLTLGGPGCCLLGLSNDMRLSESTRPVAALIVIGLVTGIPGAWISLSPLVLNDFRPDNGFFWIGTGLFMGGGFWCFLAWVTAEDKRRAGK